MLSFADFAKAARSTWRGPAIDLNAPFRPSTDSRTLALGEVFVALRGPSFDGNAFAKAALARGCRALVLDDAAAVPNPSPVPYMVVKDAKRAYLAGAAAARRASDAEVIGITGSNGKTTTKEMASQLLAPHFRTLATPQNENNELGVAKICYLLGDDVDVAVVEMGARHPGEIAQLVDIAAPDIGILTNIGEAHLEYFKDREELARTKFALFRDALPVCNADDEWSRKLAAEYGLEIEALWIRIAGDHEAPGDTLEADHPKNGLVDVTYLSHHAASAEWHLAGEHHLRDALLAAGAAIGYGVPFEDAIAGFGALHLPEGRFEQHVLPSGATCVYDAYNANPTSVAQALRAFADVPARRRYAVLGSMAELGPEVEAMHRATGAAAARASLDALYCGGPYARALIEGAQTAGMPAASVHSFESNAEIADLLANTLRSGDAVLLKGSRVQRMEEILQALLAGEKRAS
ncbi:MAG TPA: UDP-N-acetylmuramoyl-tripeptide--D-alanyl-D-alanine ligase [Candidatus Eremiobacteraceae bacterium]|nr:UDP-N-acetylmuramoyl-tripeptide--D-alanyl-D-alanine ligase [Candidatus Eremiobacteraceae bacterium]